MPTLFAKFRHTAAALLVFAGAALLAGPAAAADYKIGSLDVTQPWARATPKGASTGAAYMTVTNSGSQAARLSCASTVVAATCQIHEMAMSNGVMRMRPVEGGLEIKPGQTVTLKPGGYHVMLMDLSTDLVAGSTIELDLVFEHAGTVAVQAAIRQG